MRWRRIAFWFSFGTLALLVLAIAWLFTADLGVFKPQVENLVTEKTGRQLAIDGEFHVDLAGSTSVIAENVRFQNAEWAEDTDMVTVGRVEVRLDLWSLIRGPLVIELIDIDDAQVQLLNPADREPNWVLPIERVPAGEAPSPGLDILLEQIYIDRVAVTLDSHERNRPLDLQLKAFRQQHRADGLLDVLFDSTLNGKVVSLEGELGTWDALRAGKEVQFDIEAVLDTFEVSGSGRIDDLENPRRPEIEFTAIGPDIDDLTRLLGLGDEGGGDINLTGSLQQTVGELLLLQVDGNVGQTEIQSRGTVSDLQDPSNINFDLTASGPDLGRILRMFGIHQVREAPFMVRVDAKTEGKAFIISEGNMVFGEAQIDLKGRMPNFPTVDDAQVNLLIEGPDIARFRYVTGLPGAAEGAFKLGFAIDVTDDGVEVLELDLKTSLGEIRGQGRLGEPPDFLSSEFDLSVRSDSLQRVADAYGVAGMPDYPFEVQGAAEYVEGAIRSIRPLTATVGDVSATVDGFLTVAHGVVGTDAVFALKGPDLAELIGAFTEAEGVPPDEYDLRGRLQVRDDGYQFRGVQGIVGTSAVEVNGLLTTKPGLAGTRFSFKAEGPDFENIMDRVIDLEVREGPYQLSGNIGLQPDLIRFDDIELDRETGHVSLDLEIGLPLEELRFKYDFRARGSDVRTLIAKIGPFEFNELPADIEFLGEQNGSYLEFKEFKFRVGDALAQSQGVLEFGEGRAESRLQLRGNVPSLARLATLNGRKLRDQSLSWSADLEGGGGELRVENLLAKIGDSDINGKIYYKAGDVPELDITVGSESIVLAPLLEEKEFEYDPEPEFEDGKFIPDIAVPFDAMTNLNLALDIDIRSLQRDSLLMRDIEFDAYLRDGALDIPKAGFRARSGALTARARLEPTEDSGAATIQLVARQFALGMTQMNEDLGMTGDIDINLDSTGADLRTLLGSANGVFFLNARGGRVTSNRLLQRLYGDLLTEILGTINPFRQTDPYTDFNCVVVPLKIDDGKVSSTPNSFINTTKIRIAATSSIDLKTEDLRVTVRTTPERALSISAGELVNPYVQVVGTLAAPRLAVDEAGLLITGGAAVATGGLTILARGVWDRLSRSNNPCKQASDRAIEELADRFPDLAIARFERIE